MRSEVVGEARRRRASASRPTFATRRSTTRCASTAWPRSRYLLVVGKREAEEGTVALRRLGSDEHQEVMSLDEAVAAVRRRSGAAGSEMALCSHIRPSAADARRHRCGENEPFAAAPPFSSAARSA